MSDNIIDEPGWRGAIARFWRRSYAADYLGYALLVAGSITVQQFEPFHRMFSLDDRSKSFPHAEIERVSGYQNIIYAGAIPLVLLICWAVLLRPGVHKVHVTILGLFISLTLASFITDVIKNAVGRPRPDLIARCKPRPGTPGHNLVTVDICTEKDRSMLQDGWRSFPSGHSSFSFSGLGYFALFLAGQLHTFRPHTDLFRVLVSLAPLLGALMIALSRLADYRHDVYDVTCGSILGMSIAYLSYRRYYRRLHHSKCNEPYPSRAEYFKKARLNNGRPRGDIEEQRSYNAAYEFELDDLESDEAESYPLTANNDSSSSPRPSAGKKKGQG